MGRTTINIEKEVRDALKSKRKYKRETYDEIIKRIIKDRETITGKGEMMDSYTAEDQIKELKKRMKGGKR